uniref:FAD-dependent oxidoreductase n=1 Tax=Prevotella sp. GTC17259 TaxID=3236795 RepID=A0AB33J609_9BACT
MMESKKIQIQNLIIGFGKAGKTLAAELAKNGQKVILAERSDRMYGGTCINIGCIPSKRLLTEAERLRDTDDKLAAFPLIMQRKETLTGALRQANLNKLTSQDNIQVINAEARFLSPDTVCLTGPGGEYEVKAERIFINTGVHAAHLSIPGSDGKRIYDSTGFLALDELPHRVVIVGGGYISLEFASMYTALGSKVVILEAGSTFLAREDRDIAEEMQRILLARGVEIVLNAQTIAFEESADDTTVITSQGNFPTDAVLIGIGRRPNTVGLDLQKAGITPDARGFIPVDDHLQAAPNIWAMGDVAGSPQFTYMSLDDYRIVRDQLLGDGKRHRNDRQPIPTTVFTFPPLSHIGMTETQATQQGLDVTVKKLPTNAIPKAKVLGQTDGLLKAVIDNKTGLILGATLFCAESHELINLIKMAIDNHIPASYLRNQIFTHPTMAEALNDLF